jgi:hypothetical protein
LLDEFASILGGGRPKIESEPIEAKNVTFSLSRVTNVGDLLPLIQSAIFSVGEQFNVLSRIEMETFHQVMQTDLVTEIPHVLPSFDIRK